MNKIITPLLLVVLINCACRKNPKVDNEYNLPISSRITLDGYYGCINGHTYVLNIVQNDESIEVSGVSGFLRFKRSINPLKYGIFMENLLKLQPFKLKNKYGAMHSTGDFWGTLTIVINDNDQIKSKDIKLTLGKIEDFQFKRAFGLIMGLLTAEERID